MKKTDWTDRMLAALVELYPVETTAYTAAVLNLSESTSFGGSSRFYAVCLFN